MTPVPDLQPPPVPAPSMAAVKSDPIVPIPPADKLSYDQSNQLMSDPTFKGRVKTACLKYADSIYNEPTSTTAHNTKLRWAHDCQQNPDQMAATVVSPTVLDDAVQTAGSDITDTALQGSVEATINKAM